MPLSSSFVRVRNGEFELDGARFPIVGANNYYLAYASPAMRGAVLQVAREMSLNVLRSWAFLDCGTAAPGAVPPGAWGDVFFQYWNSVSGAPDVNGGPNGLERLDHLIADAESAGIRLILTLVNYWPNFGGMDQYCGWFGGASREQFYRDPRMRAAYQAYLTNLLSRRNSVTGRLYVDEPAILAWELANEPECPDGGDSLLLDWISTMSRVVKQSDRNHLLAVGDEGFFDGDKGADFKTFLAVPEIDFGTFHLYPQDWKKGDPLLFGVRWIEDRIAAARGLGKPAILQNTACAICPRRR
jgi:mannan endo-1,4-beta-mannosidase